MILLVKGDMYDYLPLMESESVSFVFSDLPYGTTQQSWDSAFDMNQFWSEINRVCLKNAAVCATADDKFAGLLQQSNPNFRYKWYWEKNTATGHLNAKHQPMLNVEEIHVFYQKRPNYSPIMTLNHKPMSSFVRKPNTSELYGNQKGGKNRRAKATTRYPQRVLRINAVRNDHPDKIHPNQKPVELISYLLKTYLNPDGFVLDPTAGSFTSVEAALQLGLDAIGIELDQNPNNPQLVQRAFERLSRDYPLEDIRLIESTDDFYYALSTRDDPLINIEKTVDGGDYGATT